MSINSIEGDLFSLEYQLLNLPDMGHIILLNITIHGNHCGINLIIWSILQYCLCSHHTLVFRSLLQYCLCSHHTLVFRSLLQYCLCSHHARVFPIFYFSIWIKILVIINMCAFPGLESSISSIRNLINFLNKPLLIEPRSTMQQPWLKENKTM